MFYRLVEFYRKLYQRILSSKPEGKFTHKIEIYGFGCVRNDDFNRIKLALLVQTLSVKDEIKKIMLNAMPDYVLNISGELAALKICL